MFEDLINRQAQRQWDKIIEDLNDMQKVSADIIKARQESDILDDMCKYCEYVCSNCPHWECDVVCSKT